jgi:ribose transport system permease protein
MQYNKVKSDMKLMFKNIHFSNFMVYIVFLVTFMLFALTLKEQGFTSSGNLMNILRQTAMISVMAAAGTFVIAAGQIDLTVGAVAAMTAMISSLALQYTNSIVIALIAGLGFGVISGAINGLLVTKLGIPSFLATMGMMQVVRGSAMWITNTAAVPIDNDTFTNVFGIGGISGISVLILWTILIYIIAVIVFNKTAFGRHVLATGGNEVSAGYSGINTNRIKRSVFIISGVCASFAGILYAARMQAGRFSYAEGDELTVIAAVILGGAAMSGGSGSIMGALAGSILMGLINNALILSGLSSAQQTIVTGSIIILAVALSNLSQKKKS